MLKNNKPTEMLKKQRSVKTPQIMPEVEDAWDDDYAVTLPANLGNGPEENAKSKKSSAMEINLDLGEEEDSDSEEEDSDSEEEVSDSDEDSDDSSSDEESDDSDSDEASIKDDESKPIEFELIDNFDDMTELNPDILHGIYAKGIEKPVASQQLINDLIKHKHKSVVIDASTGSGKTISFGAVVASLVKVKVPCLQVVLLVPTHVLALQIYNEIKSIVAFTGISVALHRGAGPAREGEPRDKASTYLTNHPEKNKLGTEQIVIGTPGKILSLFMKPNFFDRRHVKVPNFDQSKFGYSIQFDASTIQQVVLDEGDGLLKSGSSRGMGDDVTDILEGIRVKQPSVRFMLYSATASKDPYVEDFMLRYDAQYFSFTVNRSQHKSVSNYYVVINTEDEKCDLLADILATKKTYNSVFVFCNTRVSVQHIYKHLKKLGYSVGEANSNMTQTECDSIIKKFRRNELKILVTTDVCARGIDVNSVDLVINVDITDPQTHTHRAGRAGRFSKCGTCITFVLALGKGVPHEILGLQAATHCLFNHLTTAVLDSTSGYVPT